MSDDSFDDDSFLFDESVLEQIDTLAATAVGPLPSVSRHHAPAARSTSAGSSKGWTGPQGNVSAGSSYALNSRTTFQTARPLMANQAPRRPHSFPARQPQLQQLRPPPSSDDFDDFHIAPESFLAIDSLTKPKLANPASKPTVHQRSLPSSRSIGRTSSGEGFLQTHLNFRRDTQHTKGKVWDRTAFAESGRRIGAEKGKGKGKLKAKSKGWDDDEEEDIEEEEDGWGAGVLAPYPKPFVDPSVYRR
jgi:hypothetical protein